MYRVDGENIGELSLSIADYGEADMGSTHGIHPKQMKAIIDAEMDVVALVQPDVAENFKKILEWAIENYPYDPYPEHIKR